MLGIGGVTGVLGVLLFIAHIWAILNVAQSHTSMGTKLLWVVLLLLLPLVGLIAWFFLGPRGR